MGPELDTAPTSLIQLACEKIVDKSNYHTYVVIGGIGTYEPRIWDTQTGVVIIDDQADPAAYNKRYIFLIIKVLFRSIKKYQRGAIMEQLRC